MANHRMGRMKWEAMQEKEGSRVLCSQMLWHHRVMKTGSLQELQTRLNNSG